MAKTLSKEQNLSWFQNARYGMLIQYGLYSLIGRGEWVLNKEEIPVAEYKKLMNEFTADKLDWDQLVYKAKHEWKMNYITFTTKHHDGFCLYDSDLTDFTSVRSAAKRDLVKEFVDACRKHNMGIGIYFSLNDWTVSPNAVDALERPLECYQKFIDYVHKQAVEVAKKFAPFNIFWYDGWWPFDGDGWQAYDLTEKIKKIVPGVLFNGRSGAKGDFLTPEMHVTSYREPWEACLPMNENWCYHPNDHNWKSPKQLAEFLRRGAAGIGNVLLNVAPKGDGSIPSEAQSILDTVGKWVDTNRESLFDTIRFELDLRKRADGLADFGYHGRYSARQNAFYLHVHSWPGRYLCICGLECKVKKVSLLQDGREFRFTQNDGKLEVFDLPEQMDTTMPVVIKFETDRIPRIYKTGGARNPRVPHCRYDPLPSEIQNL